MVVGAFADLCVVDVGACAQFYRELLGLDVLVDHGWYIELGMAGWTLVAFVAAGHSTVPDGAEGRARGVLVSFEVDDAAAVASRGAAMGCAFALPLTRDLGQFHCVLVDPNGSLVDVIERVPLTSQDRRRLVLLRRDFREVRPC